MANEFSSFPPNLDDGELWLPSDIFLNELSSGCKPHLHRHHPFSCMDDLAPRFAALSLAKHQHKLPKATNFERLKEPVRYSPMNGTGGFEKCKSIYGFRTGPSLGGTEPVYEFQLFKPTQAQEVESYVEARARVLQRQQNRLVQNRVLPFQANGFVTHKFGLGGGLVRESGGTGVFHPRIVTSNNQNATAFDSKKKQSVRNRQSQEIQVTRQINSMVKRVGVGKQEDCYYHLPPEMGLPRDWTY